MAAKKKGNGQKQTTQQQQNWQCINCSEVYTGPKTKPVCPVCGSTEALELNQDNIPTSHIERAITNEAAPRPPTTDNPDTLASLQSYDNIEHEQFRSELDHIIRQSIIERSQASLVEAKAKRRTAENQISALDNPTREQLNSQSQSPASSPPNFQNFNPMLPSLLSTLAKTPEEREDLLKRLAEDPQLALNLSTFAASPSSMPAPGQLTSPQMPPFFPQSNQSEKSQTSLTDLAEAMKSITETSRSLSEQNNPAQEQINSIREEIRNLGEHNNNNNNPTNSFDDLSKIIDVIQQVQAISGSNKEQDEEKRELKDNVENLRKELYNIRIENAEKKQIPQDEWKKALRETLAELAPNLNTESNSNSLPGQIKKINETVSELQELYKSTQPENQNPDQNQKEPFDEWHKRHIIEKDEREQQQVHEKEMGTLAAKKAKNDAVSTIIKSALESSLNLNQAKKQDLEEDKAKQDQDQDQDEAEQHEVQEVFNFFKNNNQKSK